MFRNKLFTTLTLNLLIFSFHSNLYQMTLKVTTKNVLYNLYVFTFALFYINTVNSRASNRN